MLTKQAAIKISKDFLNDLKSSGVNIRKAYLYGSYAQNRQHEHSDIDVALIADEFTGIGPVDIKLLFAALFKYKQVHAKTYSIEDLNEGDPFLEEIIRTGKMIN